MQHTCHNEERLRKLETDGATMSTEIKNLVKSLDSLTGWIKGLVIALIPVVATVIFGVIGWLVVQLYQTMKG
jgi:hypothetical protein